MSDDIQADFITATNDDAPKKSIDELIAELNAPKPDYDAIRPESPDMDNGGYWSECESCKMIVHIDELDHDGDAAIDESFTHNGHVA